MLSRGHSLTHSLHTPQAAPTFKVDPIAAVNVPAATLPDSSDYKAPKRASRCADASTNTHNASRDPL